MDGVIYRENQLITGAADFVHELNATGTPFLFLTNNSAPTAEDLAVRLKHLGIPGLSARHFYTSALNTADFLSETDPGCTVFVIGEGGLYQPTRVLQSVADLIEEIKTGKPSDRMDSPTFNLNGGSGEKYGHRHQTDILAFFKPHPRPAMTK